MRMMSSKQIEKKKLKKICFKTAHFAGLAALAV